MRVWSTPETRPSLISIRELLIDTPGGGHVRLEDVVGLWLTPDQATMSSHQMAQNQPIQFFIVPGCDQGIDCLSIQRARQFYQP
jgi:hypothetical protein